MAHSPSDDSADRGARGDESFLTTTDRRALLDLARGSIAQGLMHGRAPRVELAQVSAALQAPGASFVTLHHHGQLRGCVGTLEACRPLAQDVAENAYASAFQDPRFSPLGEEELEGLDVHISVLSPPQPISCASERDLLAQLRPGVDGLILEEAGPITRHRGTFLPAVWETLPDPQAFVRHLKLKAGLPVDYWSSTLRFHRYTALGVH